LHHNFILINFKNKGTSRKKIEECKKAFGDTSSTGALLFALCFAFVLWILLLLVPFGALLLFFRLTSHPKW